VVHSDLWGPAPVLSKKGHRYYVQFTDEFSRFSWLYTCAAKSDVTNIFAQFKQKVENLLNCQIKVFQCDGGSEFKPIMKQFPEITFQILCPYTPEQNDLAERKHRHVVELGLANMTHASIPLQFWDYIFESIVYVINRLPSVPTGPISPFEMLFKGKPDYTMLHVLGCSCYPLLRPYNAHKLESRSERCVFLGYSMIHKGYYCLNIKTNRLYISRHVIFDENSFPFSEPNTVASASVSNTPPILTPLSILQTDAILTSSQSVPTHMSSPTVHDNPIVSPHIVTEPQPTEPSSTVPTPTASPSNDSLSHTPTNSSLQHASSSTSHPMLTRTKTKSLKPKAFPNHQLYIASGKPIEPSCYTQAVKDPS
jgi:hypothetical protein